jgi:hypothetical protein
MQVYESRREVVANGYLTDSMICTSETIAYHRIEDTCHSLYGLDPPESKQASK